ncbi:FG-GAP repeat domain-containing protein [Streptomyces rochei]|uniref:FG-GAP repeat domain-containing protein n=1 Tax=Streptomyces rochei TaxID=1928 RepID=UPI0038298BFF
MDVPGDDGAGARRRVGRRWWAGAAGAGLVASAVLAGAVIATDPETGLAAPHACRTSVHGSAPASQRPATGPAAASAADFDGDGHPDLAFGSQGDVAGGAGGGSIQVAYGAEGGTGPARCQHLTQDDPGIPGKNRDESFFGSDVVARDFDEDGYTDLAAAVFDGKPSVIVMWGSADGLSRAVRVPGTDTSHVSWDDDPILDEQLAAGDFDGDGHADLVFGLGSDKGLLEGPFERDGTPARTAAVPAPRRPAGDVDGASYGDLVAGDLDGDGADELVTFHYDWSPDASWSRSRRPVGLFRGGPDGLTRADGVDLPDAATGAVGDVDGDGYGDLVLSPRGGDASRSSVMVVYGSESGPGKRRTTIDRDTPGVPGEEPQDEDAVFVSLDTGDVNGDGYADVVAGASRWGPYVEPGPEQVLFLAGGPEGPTGEGARVFEGGDLPGSHERAGFGAEVALSDLDGDHRAELVVAEPGGDTADGSVWLLPGTDDGPSAGGVTRLSGDTFDDDERLDLLMGGGGIAH